MGAQLWIVATPPVTPDMVQLSEPIQLWNVLSYVTIWSNILVTAVAYQGVDPTGWYLYHFINVDDIGYGRSLLNLAGITVLLLAVAWIFVLLDRKLRPRPIT